MMNLNRFCFYALMCFTTPRPELTEKLPLCKFYQSEDVNRTSLVIDLKDPVDLVQEVKPCFAIQPTHTLLFHTSSKAQEIQFSQPGWDFINLEHLILVGVSFPFQKLNSVTNRHRAESLTVIENRNIMKSTGLQNYDFKHIYLKRCNLFHDKYPRLDEMLFTKYVQSIVFEETYGFDPTKFKYYLAPNLKKLTIDKCDMMNTDFEFNVEENPFQKLETLNLRENGIQTLSSEAFSSMPILEELDLSNNLLKSVEAVHWPPLKKLKLHGNPLEGSNTLCKFLRNSPSAVYGEETNVCPLHRK